MKPDIALLGLGYIGLPTAVTMANTGMNVIGVDVDALRVAAINQGEAPRSEPGLQEELSNALASGKFKAVTEVPSAENYIIAVPTPLNSDSSIDMQFIEAAARSIAPVLEGGELIILESTSPPTTTDRLARIVLEMRSDLRADGDLADAQKPPIYFAHCPERILPGKALEELRNNDRIIGGTSPAATRRAAELYGRLCTGKMLETDALTAELAKLTENSFRDVNIAFANELSIICDKLGVNVWELIDLANHHPRVNILNPGAGVGGHCIAVDPWFIVNSAPDQATLIRTARQVNDSKIDWVVRKVADEITSTPRASISILGLSYKPDIEDLRESPAVKITSQLLEKFPETQFRIAEPNIDTLPTEVARFSNAQKVSEQDAISFGDVLVVLVSHTQFKRVPVDALNNKVIIDPTGLWQ